jgi:hypothetical protein
MSSVMPSLKYCWGSPLACERAACRWQRQRAPQPSWPRLSLVWQGTWVTAPIVSWGRHCRRRCPSRRLYCPRRSCGAAAVRHLLARNRPARSQARPPIRARSTAAIDVDRRSSYPSRTFWKERRSWLMWEPRPRIASVRPIDLAEAMDLRDVPATLATKQGVAIGGRGRRSRHDQPQHAATFQYALIRHASSEVRPVKHVRCAVRRPQCAEACRIVRTTDDFTGPRDDRNCGSVCAPNNPARWTKRGRALGRWRVHPACWRLPRRPFPPVMWLFVLLTWRGGMEPAHPANKAVDNASDPKATERKRLRRSMMVGFILHLSGLWAFSARPIASVGRTPLEIAGGVHDVGAASDQRKCARQLSVHA